MDRPAWQGVACGDRGGDRVRESGRDRDRDRKNTLSSSHMFLSRATVLKSNDNLLNLEGSHLSPSGVAHLSVTGVAHRCGRCLEVIWTT